MNAFSKYKIPDSIKDTIIKAKVLNNHYIQIPKYYVEEILLEKLFKEDYELCGESAIGAAVFKRIN